MRVMRNTFLTDVRWTAASVFVVGVVLLGTAQAADPTSTLIDAARSGDVAAVREVVQANKGVVNKADAKGLTPLMYAAAFGRADVVKLLLQQGADVNALGPDRVNALVIAVGRGEWGAAKAVAEGNVTPGQKSMKGRTALVTVALFCNNDKAAAAAVAEKLFARKANANDADKNYPALGYAAINGCDDLATTLIRNGASTTKAGGDGKTPIHLAAENGATGVVKALIDGGVDPNLATKGDGLTALHFAAFNGQAPVAKTLVAARADVNRRDAHGNTPLGYASHKGHSGLVSLLRENGASAPAGGKALSVNDVMKAFKKMGGQE